MRRLSIPLLGALATLLIPTAAHATGNQGGHSGSAPAPEKCACCGPLTQRIDQLNLVFDQRVTVLEQKVAELQNTVVNLTNYVNEINTRVTTVINRLESLTCRSNRIYEFRLRREVDGQRVVRLQNPDPSKPAVEVAPGLMAGQPRGSFRQADDRFVISADYRGIEAPNGQLRTVTVHAVLADGRFVRLVQFVRLCLEDDGNPNDTSAQDRAGEN